MNESCLTFIHVLSPLHAGTGQGVGVIDLPIAREKATNLPFLPGSTLKGTLKDVCEGQFSDKVKSIFGEGGDQSAKAGSAIFSDQHLLCLAVRSLFGTFAWVTSPYILERFKRDCSAIGQSVEAAVPTVNLQECVVASDSVLKSETQVILEDLDLNVTNGDSTDLALLLAEKIFANDDSWGDVFIKRFCIVSDDVMNFLAETATEVTARNVLDDNKISKNLWYEESLPTETILSGILTTVHVNADAEVVFSIVKSLTKTPIQLGGNMTVGRGLCKIITDHKGGTANANA